MGRGGVAVPKPEPRAKIKAKRDRADAKARKLCVEAVWKRAGGRCEICGLRVWRVTEAQSVMHVGHVHERLSRALGGDPHDPDNCVLLCFP